MMRAEDQNQKPVGRDEIEISYPISAIAIDRLITTKNISLLNVDSILV